MLKRVLSFLKIPGIIALIVLSAELILRITGHLIVPLEKGYGDISHDSDKIRILALGESTTDERFARGKAWTNQLEKMLTDKGHEVRIYNEGKVGTNSALLLSRLPYHLEHYRPHIVITMMGINDTESMSYNFNEPTFKLQKMFRLLNERVRSRLSCEVEAVHPTHVSPDNVKKWLHLSGKEKLPELEKNIREVVKTDKEVASSLAVIASVIKNHRFPFDASNFMHLLDRAHALHPRNDHNLRLMMHVLTAAKSPRCLEISQELLPCGVNLSDEFLKLITDCHRVMKKPLSNETFEIRGISLANGSGFTAKHYQQLAEILKKRNITLIAMQYPTLPLESLKRNFSAPEHIVFVPNEENFREALKAHKYREIFQDNFRATWGHTTELGHGIIASSAYERVEPIVREKKSRK